MRSDFPTSDDLVAYLRGRLSKDEQAELETRLAHDTDLRRELDHTRTVLEIVESAAEETTVRRVNAWLDQAASSGASDLHLDLTADGGVLRLRIDGVLHVVESLESGPARAALGRLKQLCGMAPANFAQPEDGRGELTFGERRLDLRGSYLPGVDGGRVCLRFLSRDAALAPWDRVFPRPANAAAVRRLMGRPYGLILVVGPTGSGKTTVMYTLAGAVANEQVNVVSLEDPVEFNLPWIAQAAIRPWLGLGYVEMLRAVMRQDPDVILLADLPDLATAHLAVNAALTGHLVVATLHQHDCLSAIAHLRDLGLESFLLASTLAGVVSSRLVRRVCPDCGVDVPPRSATALMALGLDGRCDTVREGRGCDTCRQTGYKGRSALLEIVEVNQALSDALGRDAPREVLAELAFSDELPSFRGQAAELVTSGVTTPEEAYRVLATM